MESYFYIPRRRDANLKYIINEVASTSVVMNGLAITAGSSPILLARIGRKLPINLAIKIVTTSV